MPSHRVNRDCGMYGDIKLFSGRASPELANGIAKHLNLKLSGRDLVQFSNENIFVKLNESVRGQDVFVIQTSAPPIHRNLMEMLILLQTLRLDSAGRITAVTPYLAYARSDKKDMPRVPITARLITDMIEVAGADRYITLDLHAGQIQGFFSIPGDVLTAFHLITDYVKNLMAKLKDPVVVAADLGFAKKGRNFAAKMGVPIAFVEKRRRNNDEKAEALTLIGNVENRDVIIVDDEVDTAGSMSGAVKLVKDQNARDVYIVFVHPVLSQPAIKRLEEIPVKEIITTDTIPIPYNYRDALKDKLTVLSVAPLLGEVILRAHEGRSVGEMFHE